MWFDLFKYNILDEMRLLKKKITIPTQLKFPKKFGTLLCWWVFFYSTLFSKYSIVQISIRQYMFIRCCKVREFLERSQKFIDLCCCLCRHIDTLSGRVHGWDRDPPRSVSDSSPRLSWGVGTASSACKRASTRALPKRDRTSEQAARYSSANSNRQCQIISLLTTISKNLFCNFSFCNYFAITILKFEWES